MEMLVDLNDQIACLVREYKRRKKVLPILVEQGRMTQETATHELAAIQAARQTLTQLKGLVGVAAET
jgi:hypothetical protein